MGVVYAAHDERLDRLVAIKRIRHASDDARLRDRLLREARTAASISHPNVCHVYELAEEQGELYLVMELLSGDPLSERIARGTIPLVEALQVTLGVLGALEALHSRGIVHRDLKPSNVFLTSHGVKLLDFGLARPPATEAHTDPGLTSPGMIVGTPRYMPPEQWDAETIVPASDLFAVGAVLFEMLAGKPAFGGATPLQVYHAVAHAQPPALAGGPDVVATDRVIQRALAKRPEHRYQSAAEMAQEVRAALTMIDSGAAEQVVQTTTRLIVLPFRVLRPDPETDFLAFSVPDAITASLTGLDALVVRSTAAAQSLAGEAPDLKVIAADAGVDVVLTGTLLRAGDEVRVSTQLVEAPGGTLVTSHTAQVRLTDIFRLQDDLARQVVESLAIPLSARDHRLLRRDIPRNANAYEFYLRGNHLGNTSSNPARLLAARDQYRLCLEEDPSYAPGWARLGRVHRVLVKYGYENSAENLKLAEEAFHRALEINPDLPLAHNLYTYFEIEERARAPQAMVRLLHRVQAGAADPNLYAGLVVACRFCGLLDASLAADRRARQLDPGMQTSVQYTYWMLADWPQSAAHDVEDIRHLCHGALWMMGRHDEAIAGIREIEPHLPEGVERWSAQGQLAAFEGRRDDCVRPTCAVLDAGFHDPEGLMLCVRNFAYVGEAKLALATLDRMVAAGFHCPAALARDPWLDSLRGDPQFIPIVHRAEAGHIAASEAYLRAGGERLLGAGIGPG